MPDEEQKTIEDDKYGADEENVEGDESEDEGPKISLPEGILMVMLSLIGELLDIIDLGWLVGFPIQLWLIMKGGIAFRKQVPALVGNLIELIPILDWLPIRTLTLLITIYMINHPKVAKKIAPKKIAPMKK